MITQEVLDFLASLEKRLNKKICCQDCIKLTGCTDNQIAIFDSATGTWVCGDFPAEHDMVTLNAGVVTQNGANLVGQELELVAAGAATYGLVKLEDLVTSIAKFGDVQLTGDVTLSAGSNITLTQVGNDIEIAASGGSSASVISPAQITADQDDYNPAGFSTATMVRLDFDTGGRAITGFAAGTDGQKITLSNISANFGYYPGSHPDSSAGNRILVPSDFIHYPYTNIEMVYDGTSAGWRIVGEQNTEGKNGVFYSTPLGSITAADYGEIEFRNTGGAFSALSATTSLPSGFALTTSTSSTGNARLHYPKSSSSFSSFGASHMWAECYVSIPTLSDVTEDFTAAIQLTNDPGGATLEVNNSFGIRYSHSIAGGDWELYTQNNSGTESTDDLDVAVAAATLYKLRIELDKSNSEVRAYINGTYVGRVITNLPNAVVCGAKVAIQKSAGTTARTLNVHAFSAGAIY